MQLTITAANTLTAAEMTELIELVWSDVQELKGYFTESEKGVMGASVRANVARVARNGQAIANATCKVQKVMMRKATAVEVAQAALDEHWADYQAVLAHTEFEAMG